MSENGVRPAAEDAEARMRQIAKSAGLGEPDEVRHEPEHNEIVLIWEEEKLAIVVELDE